MSHWDISKDHTQMHKKKQDRYSSDLLFGLRNVKEEEEEENIDIWHFGIINNLYYRELQLRKITTLSGGSTTNGQSSAKS